MPNGLWYAGGDYIMEQTIPSSAFSAGDVLVLTSASSISRIADAFPAGKIAGIAVCSSLQSIQNKVPYLIPKDDTLFWASCDTALSSHLTVGYRGDINFGLGNNRYFVAQSASSVRVVIVRGTEEVDQSTQSHVLVRLLSSGAESAFI